MRKTKNREVKIGDDGQELICCNVCFGWKPFDEYYKMKRTNSVYYFPYCKSCEIQRQNNRKEKRVNKTELDIVNDMFVKLGYEIDNPDNPVHIQFERKYKKWGL